MKIVVNVSYIGLKELNSGVEREVVEITIKNHADFEDLRLNVGFNTESEAKCFLSAWNMCKGLTLDKGVE